MTAKLTPRKNKPGQGRKPEHRTRCTIAMLPEEWARLDAMRGTLSRGKAVACLLGGATAEKSSVVRVRRCWMRGGAVATRRG